MVLVNCLANPTLISLWNKHKRLSGCCVPTSVYSLGKHRVLVTSKQLFHPGAVFISDTLPASQENCALHVPRCDLKVIVIVQVTV